MNLLRVDFLTLNVLELSDPDFANSVDLDNY